MANKGQLVLEIFEKEHSDRPIGFWTGKIFYSDSVHYPGVKEEKTDPAVKIYTSRKRAETAAQKLKENLFYVTRVEIVELEPTA